MIGSTNSSNTRALVKLAEQANGPEVIWINRADELPEGLSGTVGVTAGASAPEETVEDVLNALNPSEGVSVISHTEEDEYFPPPRNLRELLSAIRFLVDLVSQGLCLRVI